jgi:cell division protein FtsB
MKVRMKKNRYSGIVVVLVVAQMSYFFYAYFAGAHGYQKIQQLQATKHELDAAVAQEKSEVRRLQEELESFKKYPYYKEKIIREQLQMLKPDEVIYRLP